MIMTPRFLVVAALCLVPQAVVAIQTAPGICLWDEILQLCVGTNDSPDGTEWAHFQVESAICIANTEKDGSGCKNDSGLAPTVCKNQAMIDEPGSYFCLPLSAQINTLAAVQTALPPPECADVSSAHCDKERHEYVTAMGCPQCAKPFNDAATFGSECLRYTSKEACEEDNPRTQGTPVPTLPLPAATTGPQINMTTNTVSDQSGVDSTNSTFEPAVQPSELGGAVPMAQPESASMTATPGPTDSGVRDRLVKSHSEDQAQSGSDQQVNGSWLPLLIAVVLAAVIPALIV